MATLNLSVLPPVLREMLETGKYRDAHGALQSLHSNISAEESLVVYNLVRSLRPKATAEIGFALGVSGLAILGALETNGGEGRHYVCDPGQTSFTHGLGLEQVRRAGLQHRLEFYEKFPEEVFPQLPKLQFAFIDASHLFDLTVLDFVLVDKRLEIGGIVGLHDLWMPSLRKVLRYILANRAYQRHPATLPGASWSVKKRIASGLAAVARTLPFAERWIAPEARTPWHEFAVGNMVFLEKLAADERKWDQHVPF